MLLKRRKSATGARSIASCTKVICGFNAKDLRRKQKQNEKYQKDKHQKEKGKGKANKDIQADIKPELAHVSLEVGQSPSQFEPLSRQ